MGGDTVDFRRQVGRWYSVVGATLENATGWHGEMTAWMLGAPGSEVEPGGPYYAGSKD